MKYSPREDFSAAFIGKISFAQLLHFDMKMVLTENHNYTFSKQSTT